jgi:hypothetical protein
MFGLLFDPEDGCNMFLRKICWLSTDYKALYPRRQNSSKPPLWDPQILRGKFSQDTQSPDPDLNPKFPEYETGQPIIRPWYSVRLPLTQWMLPYYYFEQRSFQWLSDGGT